MCKNAQSTKEELEMFLRKQRDQFYTLAEEAQDLEGVIDPGEFLVVLQLANFALQQAEKTTEALNKVRNFSLVHLVQK
jgi:hypothetical protein